MNYKRRKLFKINYNSTQIASQKEEDSDFSSAERGNKIPCYKQCDFPMLKKKVINKKIKHIKNPAGGIKSVSYFSLNINEVKKNSHIKNLVTYIGTLIPEILKLIIINNILFP